MKVEHCRRRRAELEAEAAWGFHHILKMVFLAVGCRSDPPAHIGQGLEASSHSQMCATGSMPVVVMTPRQRVGRGCTSSLVAACWAGRGLSLGENAWKRLMAGMNGECGGYYIHELVSFWCLLLVNLEEWLRARCGTSSAIAFEGRAPLG